MNYKLVIGWLYPELMSTYGDRGNIIALQKRCEWRGIKATVLNLDLGFKIQDLRKCNLLFMGGAQDRQQTIVAEDLKKKKDVLSELIEQGTPGLYICGAYQFLGKYYKEADGTIIDGLDILDLHTENPGADHPRLIGDVLIKVNIQRLDNIVGFENHGGRTYLGGNIKPFGDITKGYGNNGKDHTEGAIYKNSFGSYLHGPILPKNHHFTDYLIKLALEKKYDQEIFLPHVDAYLEEKAHSAIVKRLLNH